MVVTFICYDFVSTVKLPTILAGLRPMGGRNIQPSLQSPLAASFSSPGGSVVNSGTTAITNRCSQQNDYGGIILGIMGTRKRCGNNRYFLSIMSVVHL